MNPAGLLSVLVRTSTDGPEVTWVGPNPFGRGLCLGFDDGTIILNNTATGETTPHQEISAAKDAINGVAAIGTRSLAVSTRSDVTFIQFESPTNSSRAVFAGGAHGVVATESGYFIALLGRKGLLLVKPEVGQQQEMRVTVGTEGLLYFYRMAALCDATGKETLVFANRRNGVGLSVFDANQESRNVHTLGFAGLDVVDVCGVSRGSLSAVAISPTAEILWIKDTSKREDPLAMRLHGVEGQVYRVLATPQHLFVLTSSALYAFANLVGKVLYDKATTSSCFPFVVPMEAVDMSLYKNEYILLVMAANSIMSVRITDLEKQPSDQVGISIEMSQKTSVEDFDPKWQRHDVEQAMMAGAT